MVALAGEAHASRLEDLATVDAEKRFGRTLLEELGSERYTQLRDSEAFGSLVRLGRSAEAAGHDAEQMLRDVVAQGRLDDVHDLGKVLHWRTEQAVEVADRRQVREDERRVDQAVEDQAATVTAAVGETQLLGGVDRPSRRPHDRLRNCS